METAIHEAIVHNNISFFDQIDDTTLKDFRQSGGASVLQLAAREGNTELAAYFIRRGLNLNATNKIGDTPLTDAITFGHNEIVELLLNAGADPTIQDSFMHNAMWIACSMNNAAAVSLLLQKGEAVNQQYADKSTPLIVAAMFVADADLLEVLLEAGADCNARDNAGYTAMTHCVMNGKLDEVATLLKHGADLTIHTTDGRSYIDFIDSIEDESLKPAMRNMLGQ